MHILRYLKGIEDFTKHKWAKEMSKLLKDILYQKKLLQKKGINFFIIHISTFHVINTGFHPILYTLLVDILT